MDNIMRHEKIVILPKNTIKLTDVLVQMEIDNAKGKLLQENFDDLVFRMVTRVNKDLSRYNEGIDKELIDELYKSNFHEYYDMSPKTLIYDSMEILRHQNFIDSLTILFPNDKCKDGVFEYDVCGQSIDDIEKYIIDNSITGLVVDDISIIKELSDRGNYDLNYKSIIVPRIGYNLYRNKDNGKLQLKYYEEIMTKYPNMESAIMNLYNFSSEVVERMKKK